MLRREVGRLLGLQTYLTADGVRCISSKVKKRGKYDRQVHKEILRKLRIELPYPQNLLFPSDWQAVIGVEVHAQLKSKKKLFSSALSDEMQDGTYAQHNTLVAPFDAALPGSLPTLQMEPLLLALKACLAFKCDIAPLSLFDRKHYFYQDLTSGYQITQKYAPLAKNGTVPILLDDGFIPDKSYEATIRIEQVQLEQDTAKSTHHVSPLSSGTLIDLNRAGSALIEIVSKPDMRNDKQAGAYIRKLREILRTLGVSDGNMDQGSLRCDVNVSINKIGEPLGVPVEVKNLNSVRFVQNAIRFEIDRQYKLYVDGKFGGRETRGYDEKTGSTFLLRSKEDSPDYRFMPDPNLPLVQVTQEMIQSVEKSMPELLGEQRERLAEKYQVSIKDINILLRLDNEEGGAEAVTYFQEVVQGRDAKETLHWLVQLLGRNRNRMERKFADMPIKAIHFGQVIDLVQNGQITAFTGRTFLNDLLEEPQMLDQHLSSPNPVLEYLLKDGKLALETDDGLTELCRQVIQDLPEEVEAVRQGNDRVVMKLIGEVMKRTKGRIDPKSARQELLQLLNPDAQESVE